MQRTMRPSASERPKRATVPVLRPQLPTFERLEPYLRRIDEARTYSNHGPLVIEFEARVGEKLHVERPVVSACSGTIALAAAIMATAGRATAQRPLALLPAYTFVATVLAVELCGYRPYVVDVERNDWMLLPSAVAERARESAGVVVPVAPYGRAFDQRPWSRFRSDTNVAVVIDAAASFDVLAEDETVAREALGEIPVALSFHATKSFATGEGGAIVTTDARLRRAVEQSLNVGFHGSRDCQVPAINGKLSEYHAAVGLAGLDMWTENRAAMIRVARSYRRAARAVHLVDMIVTAPEISGTYALFAGASPEQATRVAEHLRSAGVETRFWYGGGVHRNTHFSGVERDPLPVAENLAGRLLGLPVAPDLTDGEISWIVSLVARAVSE